MLPRIYCFEVMDVSEPCVSGEQLVFLASALAAAIARECSLNDLILLGGFFNLLGDSLDIIAAQRSACGPDENA